MCNNFLILLCCSVGIVNSIRTSPERQRPPHIDFIVSLRQTMIDTTSIDQLINRINNEFDNFLSMQLQLDNEIQAIESKPLDVVSEYRLAEIKKQREALEVQKSAFVKDYTKQARKCIELAAFKEGEDALNSVKEKVHDATSNIVSVAKKAGVVVYDAGHNAVEKGKSALETTKEKAEEIAHKTNVAIENTAATVSDAGHRAFEKSKDFLKKAQSEI